MKLHRRNSFSVLSVVTMIGLFISLSSRMALAKIPSPDGNYAGQNPFIQGEKITLESSVGWIKRFEYRNVIGSTASKRFALVLVPSTVGQDPVTYELTYLDDQGKPAGIFGHIVAGFENGAGTPSRLYLILPSQVQVILERQ